MQIFCRVKDVFWLIFARSCMAIYIWNISGSVFCCWHRNLWKYHFVLRALQSCSNFHVVKFHHNGCAWKLPWQRYFHRYSHLISCPLNSCIFLCDLFSYKIPSPPLRCLFTQHNFLFSSQLCLRMSKCKEILVKNEIYLPFILKYSFENVVLKCTHLKRTLPTSFLCAKYCQFLQHTASYRKFVESNMLKNENWTLYIVIYPLKVLCL